MNLGDVPLRGTGQLGPKPMKAGSTMEAIIVYRQAADIVSYNAIDNERGTGGCHVPRAKEVLSSRHLPIVDLENSTLVGPWRTQ
jgi:hypothetical protein